MIDLHCHSLASDGLLPPAEVVAEAARKNLSAIALTDHDTTDGLAAAREAGRVLGVTVVGGCEFSVAAPWGEMHLLGYFIEPGDPEIEAYLSDARGMRASRGREMLTRLHAQGISIDADELVRQSGGGAIGRPHIARLLQQAGYVPTVQAAFD